MAGALEAERGQVDAGEQRLARAEHDRRDREVDVVHQAGAQVLADRRDAAAEAHVPAGGRVLRRDRAPRGCRR